MLCEAKEIYRRYIGPSCTRSAVDLKRYSNISEVYRSWLHSLGTRSAVELLKVFTTKHSALDIAPETFEEIQQHMFGVTQRQLDVLTPSV